MNFSAIVALAALALSSIAAIEIPVEHHERFLAEQASLISELSEWKASAAGQYAKAQGLYTEPASTDATESATVDTANLKRLYLTKLAIAEAQALNPEAVLSINTPFTLLTDDEFAAYVRRGYGSGGFDALWAAQNITLATEEVATTTTGRQLATSVDWTTSGCVAAVKDQGNCGSCWAFSTIGTLESAYCLKNGALSLFSEQQVTSCDTSNSGCDGGIMTTALAYINKAGFICSEDSYPFASAETGETGTCSTSGCDKTTISIKKVVSVTASETALVSAITTTPVAVAVAAGNTAWKQYTSGVLSSCTSSTLDHAVLAVGYDSTSFKIRNQWGTSWGDEGYIYLKRNGSKSACGVVNSYNCYPTLN